MGLQTDGLAWQFTFTLERSQNMAPGLTAAKSNGADGLSAYQACAVGMNGTSQPLIQYEPQIWDGKSSYANRRAVLAARCPQCGGPMRLTSVVCSRSHVVDPPVQTFECTGCDRDAIWQWQPTPVDDRHASY
jgi:hypothetical protein